MEPPWGTIPKNTENVKKYSEINNSFNTVPEPPKTKTKQISLSLSLSLIVVLHAELL